MSDGDTNLNVNTGGEPATQGAQPAPQTTWYDGVKDPDNLAWVKNKGYDSVESMVKGHRSLEQMFGKRDNLVALPSEGDDKSWDEFYNKIGRPETPDKYEIELPEGATSDVLFKWSKEAFHKTGLSGKQAKALYNSYLELEKSYGEQMAQEHKLKLEREVQEVERAWGAAAEKNKVVVKGAATKLGLSEEEFGKVSAALGYKKAMEVLYNAGAAMGEHNFVDGKGASFNNVMTPAEARLKESELMMDQEFRKQYLAGNPAAVEKIKTIRMMAIERK